MFSGTLIRSGNNAKTVKGDDVYETAIMYMAPHSLAAKILTDSKVKLGNVCPLADLAACSDPCLNTAGRGRFTNVQIARAQKTHRYWSDRAAFMAELVDDLERFVRYCSKAGRKPACRLNGTSDIQFEVAHPCNRDGIAFKSIFEAFPEVQFYDYTKVYKRAYRSLPANYSLTLSYSAANPAYADAIVKAHVETGAIVAVVFRTKEMRDSLLGLRSYFNGTPSRVIDGDETDMRFLDPKGSVVGLFAKGSAKEDTSGFVVD